eukprot:5201458-Lingulodinium_polyedra.AAC.1
MARRGTGDGRRLGTGLHLRQLRGSARTPCKPAGAGAPARRERHVRLQSTLEEANDSTVP